MASVKFIFLKDDFCLSVVFDSPDLVSERSDGRLDFFLNRLNNSLNFFFLNFNLGWFGLSSSSLGGWVKKRLNTFSVISACPFLDVIAILNEEVNNFFGEVTVCDEPLWILVFVELQHFVAKEQNLWVRFFHEIFQGLTVRVSRPKEKLKAINHSFDMIERRFHVLLSHFFHVLLDFIQAFKKEINILRLLELAFSF